MRKKILSLITAMTLAVSCLTMTPAAVSAGTIVHRSTVNYTCNYHKALGKSKCCYIRLSGTFNNSTGACKSAKFDASSAHWPNSFSYGSVHVYTNCAKGTYTIKCSSLGLATSLLKSSSETKTVFVY